MKKNITFLILFFMGFIMHLGAQTLNNLDFSNVDKKMKIAWEYLHGAKNKYDPEKALQIFLECAQGGDAQAMNAVGRMYISGLGTSQNSQYAIEWFTKAANAGYTQAWYNLGMIYKYANGVEQDFTKAYEYFKRSADLGYVSGMFYQGYMLYKGLGCEVNYTLAMGLFKKGADEGNRPAMYFLGLCYKNGFGINRDTLIANQWLRKAANLGYKAAQEELSYTEAEMPLDNGKLKSTRIDNKSIPSKYKQVKHNIKEQQLGGIYKGWLVKFDYSGQHILTQVPLILNLNVDGKNISGQWTESDTLTGNIEALITDTALVFTKALFKRTDHYHRIQPESWNFKKANVELIQNDTSVYIAGNIQMINTKFLEPSKPMYLSLVRIEKPNIQINQKSQSENLSNISDVIAYPNPFSNDVSLKFTLKESANVNVNINSIDGSKVTDQVYKQLDAGTHIKTFSMQIPAGTYIIMLESKGSVKTTIVVKQ